MQIVITYRGEGFCPVVASSHRFTWWILLRYLLNDCIYLLSLFSEANWWESHLHSIWAVPCSSEADGPCKFRVTHDLVAGVLFFGGFRRNVLFLSSLTMPAPQRTYVQKDGTIVPHSNRPVSAQFKDFLTSIILFLTLFWHSLVQVPTCVDWANYK